MNKDKDVKAARAKHFQDVVNKSKNSGKAVSKLAKDYYLSTDTVYRDLKS